MSKQTYLDKDHPPTCLHAIGQPLVNALWEEGRALKKKLEGETGELVALMHDGTFEGDSGFNVPGSEIPYKEGDTLKELTRRFYNKLAKEDGYEEDSEEGIEYAKEMTGAVKGAWIVTKDQLDTISLVWESDPGNDSAVYMCNHTAKKMAHHLCVKHLGKKAK